MIHRVPLPPDEPFTSHETPAAERSVCMRLRRLGLWDGDEPKMRALLRFTKSHSWRGEIWRGGKARFWLDGKCLHDDFHGADPWAPAQEKARGRLPYPGPIVR